MHDRLIKPILCKENKRIQISNKELKKKEKESFDYDRANKLYSLYLIDLLLWKQPLRGVT